MASTATTLPHGVNIEPDTVLRRRRYAGATEGAGHFLVCEALANVLKHASARHATVRLANGSGRLLTEVIDDGTGFTPNGSFGSGLRGLTDRIEALGGEWHIMSQRRHGTRLVANLPGRARDDV